MVEERQDSVELFLGDVDEMDFEDIKNVFFKKKTFFLISHVLYVLQM